MIKLTQEYNATACEDNLLQSAVMKGDHKTVKFLVKNNVDVNFADKNGVTSLHYAAHNKDKDMAEILIKAGADVNAQTKHSKVTPLYVAADNNQFELVKMLLDAGADSNIKAVEGYDALQVARLRGRKVVAATITSKIISDANKQMKALKI